jgi:hypothetical protein
MTQSPEGPEAEPLAPERSRALAHLVAAEAAIKIIEEASADEDGIPCMFPKGWLDNVYDQAKVHAMIGLGYATLAGPR